jgi:hypothetical protein
MKLKKDTQLLVMQLSDDKKHIIKNDSLCKAECSRDDLLQMLSTEEMKKECCYIMFDYNGKLVLIKWYVNILPV